MKIIVFIILLINVTIVHAEDDPLAWAKACTQNNDKCILEKVIEYESSHGKESGGVAVAYDNVNKSPIFIAVYLPKDLKVGQDIAVKFVNSVKKDDKWDLEPSGEMLALPIMECSDSGCLAKVYPEIKLDEKRSVNLFDEFKKNSFLWVMYKRKNKAERFMVPLSGMEPLLSK